MARNFDFRLATGWRDHLKHRRVFGRYGAPGNLAWVQLLDYTATHHPDGRLGPISLEELAFCCSVDTLLPEVDPEEFGGFLVKVRLVDQDAESAELAVHDWLDWNEYAAAAQDREDLARRAGLISAAKRGGVWDEELAELSTAELKLELQRRRDERRNGPSTDRQPPVEPMVQPGVERVVQPGVEPMVQRSVNGSATPDHARPDHAQENPSQPSRAPTPAVADPPPFDPALEAELEDQADTASRAAASGPPPGQPGDPRPSPAEPCPLGHDPPLPAARCCGTNPRAVGTNPRAHGEHPRADVPTLAAWVALCHREVARLGANHVGDPPGLPAGFLAALKAATGLGWAAFCRLHPRDWTERAEATYRALYSPGGGQRNRGGSTPAATPPDQAAHGPLEAGDRGHGEGSGEAAEPPTPLFGRRPSPPALAFALKSLRRTAGKDHPGPWPVPELPEALRRDGLSWAALCTLGEAGIVEHAGRLAKLIEEIRTEQQEERVERDGSGEGAAGAA